MGPPPPTKDLQVFYVSSIYLSLNWPQMTWLQWKLRSPRGHGVVNTLSGISMAPIEHLEFNQSLLVSRVPGGGGIQTHEPLSLWQGLAAPLTDCWQEVHPWVTRILVCAQLKGQSSWWLGAGAEAKRNPKAGAIWRLLAAELGGGGKPEPFQISIPAPWRARATPYPRLWGCPPGASPWRSPHSAPITPTTLPDSHVIFSIQQIRSNL